MAPEDHDKNRRIFYQDQKRATFSYQFFSFTSCRKFTSNVKNANFFNSTCKSFMAERKRVVLSQQKALDINNKL